MIILNPAAAGGRTGRGWPRVAERLRGADLDFDVVLTDRRGAAVELARAAVREGRPVVVAAGGDGTINEVVNGFFDGPDPIPTGSCLGLLPLGTGGDFRRMWGLGTDDPEAAARVIAAGHRVRIDAGLVTCQGPEGEAVVAFANVADAGIGGDVSDMVNRGFRLINGQITFSAAGVLTGLRYRNKLMRVVVDGEASELVAQQVVVANCRYFGGGMMIAPEALADDGLLDVVVVGDVSRFEGARMLRRFRTGTHLGPHAPKLSHRRGRRVEVTSPETVRLDVDGEVPGVAPAVFEVVPAAIEVLVPGAGAA